MTENRTKAILIVGIVMMLYLTAAVPATDAAPRIVHRPPMSVSAGTPLKMNVTVRDTVKIEKVTLNYRHMGEKENASVDMKKVSGNETEATYEATLPGNEVTTGYIFYAFNITDANGYTITETYTASVTEAKESSGQLGVFIMAMVVAVIFIILEIGLKYRHI